MKAKVQKDHMSSLSALSRKYFVIGTRVLDPILSIIGSFVIIGRKSALLWSLGDL